MSYQFTNVNPRHRKNWLDQPVGNNKDINLGWSVSSSRIDHEFGSRPKAVIIGSPNEGPDSKTRKICSKCRKKLGIKG
jgi:hypothetical protein